ncbi:ras GTPase-activating-like protein IQGAP3 isoform X2 [Gambusia affinis]|uniref:ras GTPase-activating-like protein IQGAP3 isoform X2 n=1 Tax=Gambusia affinis TaxID=33528 RepID=UPI001CDCFC09|nr:ras GTPase-activating-like protein IQGAP3 isoform X2 [Gambusia affinis]
MSEPARDRYRRLTGHQMDVQRLQNVAYLYLCRLEEAKRWMEAVLGAELPGPVELERTLRNGVTLAQLGHHFAPADVPLERIYDPDQQWYQDVGLQFRHTENINLWRSAMMSVGLPSVFYPETIDVYNGKNMAKLIHCIHALSNFLSQQALAPPIVGLQGKVSFTEEEINHMELELSQHRDPMESFEDIGDILADELSVDAAAVQTAVDAVNAAVARGQLEATAQALRNPAALLTGLQEAHMSTYQEALKQAWRRKAELGAEQAGSSRDSGLVQGNLSQNEIQNLVRTVNAAGLGEILVGKRTRRPVHRFAIEAPRSRAEVNVADGSGQRLGQIPWTRYQLGSRNPAELRPLHYVLFNLPGKVGSIKQNLRRFNGFPFDADSQEFILKRAKLLRSSVLPGATLRDICSILALRRGGTRQQLVHRILRFLTEPRDSGKRPPVASRRQ